MAMVERIIPITGGFDSKLRLRDGGELPIKISQDNGLEINVDELKIKIEWDHHDEPIFKVSIFEGDEKRAVLRWSHVNNIDIEKIYSGASISFIGCSVWVSLSGPKRWHASFSKNGVVGVWSNKTTGSMHVELDWIRDEDWE